jgi:DNA mismatch endonuclease (patch repair protein)
MSRVRSKKNVTTELRLLKLLRKSKVKGWRRHYDVPGKPDFSWPHLKVAVFVDGCFWHGHDCGRNLSPKSNIDAWREKIFNRKKRDRRIDCELRAKGWSVIRIWECQLSKDPRFCITRIKKILSLRSKKLSIKSIQGSESF